MKKGAFLRLLLYSIPETTFFANVACPLRHCERSDAIQKKVIPAPSEIECGGPACRDDTSGEVRMPK